MQNIMQPRRHFLRHLATFGIAAAGMPLARPALAAQLGARSLAFAHLHTGEQLDVVYAIGESYLSEGLITLSHFLRDHYSGEIGQMDPSLFDLLHYLKLSLGCDEPFQVISGYRCPATNQTLRTTRGGGVARYSLHMEGRAVDIRLPGVPLADLRDAAVAAGLGGVGFYPRDQFVHVDTGRVRNWQQ